ncbi:V-type ATP synthase subunit D [Scatolibacter rhodanostii]|uniref:V-type ATP synthase subunit D n=1 Tax=Scatolibacter rhodanostii TaxID=2014781 RepID=UPI000C07ECF7|nr:V-type ATP synthase subunit D [Scatolibacter rhodanostii]
MANAVVPTKANLIAAKKSLSLSKVGYDLMNRKRNILIHEMMLLIDRASHIQAVIDDTYTAAYAALQQANLTLGICKELSGVVPVETGVQLSFRSVMGVEIPIVQLESSEVYSKVPYGMAKSNETLDEAYMQFLKVKELTAQLAEVENSVYRLADAIKKIQKRANALKNIMIPRLIQSVKFITDSLEEKEREEFSRMKVIKAQNTKKDS